MSTKSRVVWKKGQVVYIFTKSSFHPAFIPSSNAAPTPNHDGNNNLVYKNI